MKSYAFLVVTLLAACAVSNAVPVEDLNEDVLLQGGYCTAQGGQCVSNGQCGGTFIRGLCPGSAICCHSGVNSCDGQCSATWMTCGTRYESEKCPGLGNVQCCVSDTARPPPQKDESKSGGFYTGAVNWVKAAVDKAGSQWSSFTSGLTKSTAPVKQFETKPTPVTTGISNGMTAPAANTFGGNSVGGNSIPAETPATPIGNGLPEGPPCNNNKGACALPSKCNNGYWRGKCGAGPTYCCKPIDPHRLLVNTHQDSPDPLRDSIGKGAYKSKGKNLAIRWNSGARTAATVDVVVHLHGYSLDRLPATTAMTDHADEYSGIDLSKRSRPTIGIIPRGRKDSAKVYTHPDLARGNGAGLRELIKYSLAKHAAYIGRANPPSIGRLILTGHSGGGKVLFPLVKAVDPHEVHVFDATYYPIAPLQAWTKKHIAADSQAISGMSDQEISNYFATKGRVFRMFYIAKSLTSGRGTAMGASLPKSGAIARYYRSQGEARNWKITLVKQHMDMPPKYGPRLLQDNGCCQS